MLALSPRTGLCGALQANTRDSRSQLADVSTPGMFVIRTLLNKMNRAGEDDDDDDGDPEPGVSPELMSRGDNSRPTCDVTALSSAHLPANRQLSV